MDPRLRNFLRQAVALIASEKGLNARSRYKLQSLADHLKLPPELFQEALVQLQQSADASIQLNHWEKDFVTQLRRSFAKLEKKILTVSAEARIVSRAGERFQISKIRAKQLIDHCAEQDGIARVSEADAQDYVDLLIQEKVGTRIQVSPESQSQLHTIGQEWGVPREDVDRKILETLRKNRVAQKPRRSRWPLAIAATGLMVVLLVFAAYQIDWQQLVANKPNPKDEFDSVGDVDTNGVAPEVVFFADQNLNARAQALVKENPTLKSVFERLGSTDIQIRGPASVEMIADTVDAEKRALPLEVAIAIVVNEEVASIQQEFVNIMTRPLDPEQHKQPVTIKEFDRVLRVIRLLAAVRFSDSTNASTDVVSIRGLIDEKLGMVGTSSAAEYRSHLSRTTALRYWDHAIRTCWFSPGRAAVLLEPLTSVTRGLLTAEQLSLNRDRLLEAILASDFSRWREVKSAIGESVSEANEIRLAKWIGLFENHPELAFRDFLGPLISSKIDPDAVVRDRSAMVALLKTKRDEIRFRQFEGLIQRHQSLSEASNRLLSEARAVGPLNQPDLVARMVRQSNLSLALTVATKEGEGNSSWYDEKVARPFSLRSYGDIAKSDVASRGKGATRASLSDRREFEKSIERLGEPGVSAIARQSALDSLANIAVRFDDIGYQDAAILAGYLHSKMELAEWLNCEKNIPSFRRWPTLGLAISDKFSQTELTLDRGLTLVTLLMGRAISVNDAIQWRRTLQDDLFLAVREKIDRRLATEPTAEALDWRRLEDALLDLYRVRLEYVQMLNGRSGNADRADGGDHAQRLESTIAVLSKASRDEIDWARKLEFATREPAGELERIVALNQLLVEVLMVRLKQEFPQSRPDANRLFMEFVDLAKLQSDVGRRLLVAERAWLTFCEMFRRLSLQRKLNQS